MYNVVCAIFEADSVGKYFARVGRPQNAAAKSFVELLFFKMTDEGPVFSLRVCVPRLRMLLVESVYVRSDGGNDRRGQGIGKTESYEL